MRGFVEYRQREQESAIWMGRGTRACGRVEHVSQAPALASFASFFP